VVRTMSSLRFPPSFVRVHDPSSGNDELSDYFSRLDIQRVLRQQEEDERHEQRLRGQPGSRRYRRYINDLCDSELEELSSDEGVAPVNWDATFTQVGYSFFHSQKDDADVKGEPEGADSDRLLGRKVRLDRLLSKAASCTEDDMTGTLPDELAAELGAHLFMGIDQKPRALLRRGGRDQVFLQELETVLIAFKALSSSHVFSPPCDYVHPVEPLLAISFPSSMHTFAVHHFPILGHDRQRNVEHQAWTDKRPRRVTFRPDALVLQFQDSFFRLLGHGICQWHGLKSTRVPRSDGLVQIRRKWEGNLYQHNLLLMDYLNARYPRKF